MIITIVILITIYLFFFIGIKTYLIINIIRLLKNNQVHPMDANVFLYKNIFKDI